MHTRHLLLHHVARFAHGPFQKEVDDGMVTLLDRDVEARRPIIGLLVLDVELFQPLEYFDVAIIGCIVEAVEPLRVGAVQVDTGRAQN